MKGIKWLSLGLAAAIVCSLAACGSSGSPAGSSVSGSSSQSETNAFDTKYNWSFATTYSDKTVVVAMFNKFAELANEYTDGAVTITVFPNGTVASEDDALAQVSSGELEFCGSGSAPFWTYTPDAAWILAPFMITSKEVYQKVYNSDPLVKARESWATNNNVKDLSGCFYRGMRTVVSTKEIHNAADLKNVKMRMNSNAMWNAAWQSLGCTTVTIPLSELYTSIQTGVAEACDNPLSESGSLNVPEVAKYVVPTNHAVEASEILMSNSLFESLPKNYQDALVKAGQDAMSEFSGAIDQEEADWLQKYQDAGCTVLDFDTASVQEACKNFWQDEFNKEWTSISYDDAMALIAECSK